MASVSTAADGTRRVCFSLHGKRKTIRLGKTPQRAAETIQTKIESLVTCAELQLPCPDDLQRWLISLPIAMLAKLQAVGLIQCDKAKPVETELGSFLDSYLAGRTDLKPRSITIMRQARRVLVEFFSESKPLKEITAAAAADWRTWLAGRKLAENTIRNHAKCARRMFKAAIARKLITDNPFNALPVTITPNRKRQSFIGREEITAVLNACPDASWRLLVALARYGGLRIPSEIAGLTWAGVNWERSRFRVLSPKTERHPGMEERIVPIFRELRPYFDAAFEAAPEGDILVFPWLAERGTNANLRTRFLKIVARAGVKPWPRLFQNLRSSRATELADQFPSHVCTTWLGHSHEVAERNYRQTTDSHFESAVKEPTGPAKEATRIPTRAVLADGGNTVQENNSQNRETPDFQCLQFDANPCSVGDYTRRVSNPQPMDPKSIALSS